ncbi:hypothetical protein ABIE49_000433 [Bradyrhizobium sp. OAE829]
MLKADSGPVPYHVSEVPIGDLFDHLVGAGE